MAGLGLGDLNSPLCLTVPAGGDIRGEIYDIASVSRGRSGEPHFTTDDGTWVPLLDSPPRKQPTQGSADSEERGLSG